MSEFCGLCGCNSNVPLERHHKIYRSQGGSNDADNLILLCKVCHGAAHGLKVIYGTHSCKTCPVLPKYGCFFGERVLNRERVTPAPWGPQELSRD